MNNIQLKIVGTGLFFLFIFVTGFWLSRAGPPYGTGLFNVHKLLALAVLVFLIVTMVQVNKTVGLSGIEWSLGVVTLLLFASEMIAGGLLSTDLTLPTAVTTLHHVTPYLIVLSTAATLYLLLSHTPHLSQ